MRPFTSTISLDEARRRLERASGRSSASSASPLADAAGRVAAADVTVGDRRAAVLAIGDGRLRGDCGRHGGASRRRRPVRLRIARSHLHRRSGRDARRARHAARKSRPARRCPRAPTPSSWSRKRLRAGDDHVDDPRRGRRRARTSGGEAPTSRPATSSVRRGDLLNPSRVGALAAIGCVDVRGVRAAASRGAVHRATR